MWEQFWRHEPLSLYSTNNVLGPWLGPLPLVAILGALALIVPAIVAGRSGEGFRVAYARVLPAAIVAGSLLFALRIAADQARSIEQDRRYLAGASEAVRAGALSPQGFHPLLNEARRRIPAGEDVELRAPTPYPLEKGGYELYPTRISEGADHVICYREPAPADSASWELIFRRQGVGSIWRRLER